MTENEEFGLESISKPTTAEIRAARNIDRDTARSMVETYYRWQEHRVALGNQVSALTANGQPTAVLAHFHTQARLLEKQLVSVLGPWAQARPEGEWARRQLGIGPVLSAGLSAYIDIGRCPTAGSIWRYAGLEPSQVWLSREQARQMVTEAGSWPQRGSGRVKAHGSASLAGKTYSLDQEAVVEIIEKVAAKTTRRPWVLAAGALNDDGELTFDSLTAFLARRPYNPDLKTLCWKVGDSFVKVSGKPEAFYGRLYRERKEQEVARNEAHTFADQAAAALATRNITHPATLKAYKDGLLPAGRIDLRARRYAVKLFLAHWHGIAYRAHFGVPAPAPYAIAQLGHVHEIEAPE